MADAPADRGGDDARRPEISSKVYDPANPNVYYNDPASKNALARRVLEDRSRARAIRGVGYGEPGTAIGGGSVLTGQADGEDSLAKEDLYDVVRSTQTMEPVDRFSKDDTQKMSTVAEQLRSETKGDDETEAKKEKIRKRADKVAGRKLRKARKDDSEGGSRDMRSRRDILDNPENMDVTDEDVRGLLEDLGKK